MADAISPTNQTISLPALASRDPAVQAPSSSEYNPSSDDPFSSTVSTISGQPLSAHVLRTSWSRDASPGSLVEHIYTEKIPEKSPRRRLYKQSASHDREHTGESKGSNVAPKSLRNGTHGDSMADELSKSVTPQNRKSGGLRTAIRRIFGRKPANNRISLPAPVEAHRPGSSAARPPVPVTPQRSASVPSHEVLRTSALGSHSPFAVQAPPSLGSIDQAKPPRPARSPPESPIRPRRATLPSVVFGAQEAETVNRALTGLGLQNPNEHAVDGESIGFAVTSGSNPRRRSRSVNAFRDTAKEHRMSPIQWRRWRRRSDEIRYWRTSTGAPSPGLDLAGFSSGKAPQPAGGSGPRISGGFESSTNDVAQVNTDRVGEDSHFNFGLPAGDIQSQERIGLEERMITLEIKLMDFEYAISKLQAGHSSPMEGGSSQFPFLKTSEYEDSPEASAQHRSTERVAAPYMEYSPATIYGSSLDNTPVTPQGAFKSPRDSRSAEPNARPTSVATTLKPGPAGQRSSSNGLSIEHYSTLITLIRHEQSARHQLEDQVIELQRQIQLLKPPSPSSHGTGPRVLPPGLRQQRGQSSNYSKDDTSDENFEDVYVTPVERGEYERQQLEIAEGVAF